jgi:hypothetical protein
MEYVLVLKEDLSKYLAEIRQSYFGEKSAKCQSPNYLNLFFSKLKGLLHEIFLFVSAIINYDFGQSTDYADFLYLMPILRRFRITRQ